MTTWRANRRRHHHLNMMMFYYGLSLTTREAAWYLISVRLSVCLSACQTISFESLDVRSSYLHIRYISRKYGSCSYIKIIWSRSRLQEQNKVENPYSHNVKFRSAINSGSIKQSHEVCAMRLSAMADRMVWPPSLFVTWWHVTKCTFAGGRP